MFSVENPNELPDIMEKISIERGTSMSSAISPQTWSAMAAGGASRSSWLRPRGRRRSKSTPHGLLCSDPVIGWTNRHEVQHIDLRNLVNLGNN